MTAVIPESQYKIVIPESQSKIVKKEEKSELSDSKNNLKNQEIKSNLDDVVEIRKKLAKEKIEQAKDEANKKAQEIKGTVTNSELPEINVKKIDVDEASIKTSNNKLIIVSSIGLILFLSVIMFLWFTTRKPNRS
jgi:DNA-binding protein